MRYSYTSISRWYTSISRWPAIADAHALAATDVLTDDSELPLNDDTRVRITVRMRRDARQFVTVHSERWYDVIDRLDGSMARLSGTALSRCAVRHGR
jgi:hypothetical protein